MKKQNIKKIYKHRCYTIREASSLLKVNNKTCLRWIEEGLKTIDERRKPILISGDDIKNFLNNRRIKRKIKLNRYQFLCLTCKKARHAKKGSIKITGNQKMALCPVCNGKMRRIIKHYKND